MGDEIETKIISIDRKNRSLIGLSIKAKDIEEDERARPCAGGIAAQESDRPGLQTLGDLIKAQMDKPGLELIRRAGGRKPGAPVPCPYGLVTEFTNRNGLKEAI